MITTTAEYCLRAAVLLAQHHGTPLTTAQIAEATKVPSGYLAKIMQALARRKLVSARRGLGGGFRLTRPPGEITVLDVLTVIESPLRRITECPLGIASHTRLCPLHRFLDDTIRHTEDAFRTMTLEQLLARPGAATPLCDPARRRAGTAPAAKPRHIRKSR